MSIFDSFVAQATTPAAGPLAGRTVLILVADATMRGAEVRLLREIGAAHVIETASVDAALAVLDGTVSVVYAETESGGLDLLKAIRANATTAGLCTVLVTSDSNPKNAVAAKMAKVSGLVMRPYDADTLRDKMTAALQRAGA
jgi:two-component system chemotaxis response regulator CheY